METPEHIATQRLLGGDPALDFVNSAHGEGGPQLVDCLGSYDDLVAWAHHAGMIDGSAAERLMGEARRRVPEAHKIHRRSLFVRGELERFFRAIATGAPPPRDAVRHLGDAYAEALAHAELTHEDGRLVWSWPEARDLGVVLWPTIHSATELATSGWLNRVKVCAGCPWLFIDSSKNRSRRWCAMEDGCGSEAKMKNYVARRAARKTRTR
jgi:predicted RNA-binding Zn ribbon-like protein